MSTKSPFLVNLGDVIATVESFREDVAQTANTDTVTDLNISTSTTFPTEVPITGNVQILDTDSFNVVGNGIRTEFDGRVKVYFNVHVFSAFVRVGVQVRLKVNGTLVGPVSSCAYIRDANGHQESSLHGSAWLNVEDGDIITLCARSEAAVGLTVMTSPGTSNLILERRYNV